MKRLIKKLGHILGYDLRRQNAGSAPGSSGWFSLDDPSLAGPMKSGDGPAGSMQSLLEHLRARGFEPRAILDVGANRGKWSRVAKSVFPRADCFLIEPLSELQPLLDTFCRQFPGSHCFMAGAGSSPGELTFTVSEDLVASSFLGGHRVGRHRRVPIVTIDSLIATEAMPIPQLVKLDVEGFELEALRGGQKLFGKTEVFVLEVAMAKYETERPAFHEVVAFMADKGYHAYDFPGFLRFTPGGPLGFVDVCFIKSDGLLQVPTG